MKRVLIIAAAALLAAAAGALAQTNNSPIIATPPVPPTESGENSGSQAQVLDMARLKIGYCATTSTGPEATQTATCNAAFGQITTVSLAVVSNGKDLVTVTNNKVLGTDSCMAMVDDTTVVTAAVVEAISCRVPAAGGSLIIVLSNASATSPANPVKVSFLVLTAGNPR